MSKSIPRWQQGPRPLAYGDVWDAMTPAERRRSFRTDIVIAVVGVAAIYGFGSWIGL
jgi:hypothetical protein